MVPFNNPIGRFKLPKRHAGSQQDSPRERTAVGMQWQSNARDGSQLAIVMIALQRIQNELGKLRRRVVGGGGSRGSTGLVFKGEFDPSTAYDASNMVIYTPAGGSAGTYISLQQSQGVLPDTGSPNWVALPNSPPGVFA